MSLIYSYNVYFSDMAHSGYFFFFFFFFFFLVKREYLRNFCCSPKCVCDHLVTNFLHVIYVCTSCCYMKMFPGENKELNKKDLIPKLLL